MFNRIQKAGMKSFWRNSKQVFSGKAMIMMQIEGTKVFYEFSGNTLIVGGEGEIPPYSREEYREAEMDWINGYPAEDDVFPEYIDVPWRQHGSAIKTVIIQEGITTIGNGAFEDIATLETVELASSIESLGSYSFKGCSALLKIELPPSIKTIGHNAFEGCISLKQITIPTHVKNIPYSAFENCVNLERISLPMGLETIDGNAFRNCKALTSIDIPSHTRDIRNSFIGCENMSSIHIPKSINSISADAFDGCSNLERVVFGGCFAQWNELSSGSFDDERSAPRTITISKDLKRVKKAEIVCLSEIQNLDDALVLDECKKTLLYCQRSYSREVLVPSTVECIKPHAFAGCKHIQSIYIPDSVVEIGSYCFAGCISLEKVRLPYVIEIDAFYNCGNLKLIKSKQPFPKNIRRRARRISSNLIFETEERP